MSLYMILLKSSRNHQTYEKFKLISSHFLWREFESARREASAMFHLASSLYTTYTKRKQYNVLILGLENAGKTTFLEHIKLLFPSVNDKNEGNKPKQSNTEKSSIAKLKGKRILPTVGQNTITIRYTPTEDSKSQANLQNINLKFWDLGGQQSLRNLWSRYYKSCHGIVFVIDSTDLDRFTECYNTLREIARDDSWIDDEINSEALSVPILMLANKQDLPEAVDLVSLKTGVFIDIVSELEASDAKLLPVSALENQGIEESLDWLVKRLVYNNQQRAPEYK